MKNLLKYIILILPFYLNAQENSILVTGKVQDASSEGEPVKDITINLYDGNRLIETLNTAQKGSYFFSILSNHIYTIEAIKDGFISKRIQINSYCKKDSNIPEYLELNLLLKSENHIDPKYEAKYDIEFPFALINLDEKGTSFGYNIEYVNQMNELQLMAELETNAHLLSNNDYEFGKGPK